MRRLRALSVWIFPSECSKQNTNTRRKSICSYSRQYAAQIGTPQLPDKATGHETCTKPCFNRNHVIISTIGKQTFDIMWKFNRTRAHEVDFFYNLNFYYDAADKYLWGLSAGFLYYTIRWFKSF